MGAPSTSLAALLSNTSGAADSRPDPHHRLASIIPRTPTPPSASSMAPTTGAQLHPLTPRAYQPKQSSHLSPSAIPRTSFSASSSFGATSSASSSFTAPSAPAAAPPLPPLTPTSPILAFSPLSTSSIAAASPSALRAALTQAQDVIQLLRTSSAHQRLLHSLLLIDSSELRARHQVEADISSAQISVLRSHHHPELETYKRRLRRTKRKLAEYAAENTELRRRLGEEGAEGEGEGLKALGLLASRVLESETPKRKLGSPVAFKGAKRRRSRDSTISVEDPEEVDGSPSPRKRVKTAPGLGTPVSPHPSRAQREK